MASIDNYFNEIRNAKPLDKDIFFSMEYSEKNINLIFHSMAKYVTSLTKGYWRSRLESNNVEDYIQEGNIGLLRAIEIWLQTPKNLRGIPNEYHNNVDEFLKDNKPYSFITFATPLIRKQISLYREQENTKFSYTVMSEMPDFDIPYSDEIINPRRMDLFDEILQNLDGKERKLMEIYMCVHGYSPITLAEIGKQFGTTKSSIQRIISNAGAKLRNCVPMETRQALYKTYI